MHELWHDLVAPAIAATIGTGVGAGLAFWSERRNRAKRTEDERVTATNIAIYALTRFFNELEVYRLEFIEGRRTKPDRWDTLTPTSRAPPPNFDTASLSYLFELDGDAPNLHQWQ
jgi:hypothetical protein